MSISPEQEAADMRRRYGVPDSFAVALRRVAERRSFGMSAPDDVLALRVAHEREVALLRRRITGALDFLARGEGRRARFALVTALDEVRP